MVKASNRPEIRPLTGIRGFAAVLVLLAHFLPLWSSLLPALQVLDRLAGRGFLGVDLFFILSGFILNYVYYEPDQPRLNRRNYFSFIWHRFIRVWPVHFATLLLLIGLVMVSGLFHISVTGNYAWSALPFQLTMTQAWPLPGTGWAADPFAAFSWNYPAWSISAEWFAYLLVFPFTWLLLRRLRRSREVVVLGLAGLLIAGWAWLAEPFPLPVCGMVCRITLEFITGALLYQAFASGGAITRGCQRTAGWFFAALLAALLFAPPNVTGWIIILFPLLLLGLTAETALVAKLFATRPALWLGRVSYSVYMTQSISQRVLKVVLNPADFQSSSLAVRVALFAGTLGFILGLASLCYYLVENPARTRLRQWADRRARTPAN